ncbi:MAG: aspartate-semialdehyde dehydrogenase [Thermoplasmata archaeon]
MTKKKAAILGSSGMIGQRFSHMLDGHPYFDVVAYCASDRSEGKRLSDVWKLPDIELGPSLGSRHITGTDPAALAKEGVEVVFSGLPSEVAGAVEDACAEEGMAVYSNAAAHRTDPDTPILLPEINPDHLAAVEAQRRRRKKGGYIVTNANCSVTGLALGLKPLIDAFRFTEVYVATYQALSGAGYPGVSSLDILGNVLPHIKNEEEKMSSEGKKILGGFSNGRFVDAPLNIESSCARVATRDGHLEAVFIHHKDMPDADKISKTLSEFRARPQELGLPSAPLNPIIVRREQDRPQPRLDAGAGEPHRARGMAVTVGRIRTSRDNLRFNLLVHNTIRGGAGGSVLNAELAYREGLI